MNLDQDTLQRVMYQFLRWLTHMNAKQEGITVNIDVENFDDYMRIVQNICENADLVAMAGVAPEDEPGVMYKDFSVTMFGINVKINATNPPVNKTVPINLPDGFVVAAGGKTNPLFTSPKFQKVIVNDRAAAANNYASYSSSSGSVVTGRVFNSLMNAQSIFKTDTP